jgi:hypothetical protein
MVYASERNELYGDSERKLGWVHFKGDGGTAKDLVVPIAAVIAILNLPAGVFGGDRCPVARPGFTIRHCDEHRLRRCWPMMNGFAW